jgi:hypothetical protein
MLRMAADAGMAASTRTAETAGFMKWSRRFIRRQVEKRKEGGSETFFHRMKRFSALADDGFKVADHGARAADNGAGAADDGAGAADDGARAADDGAGAADDGAGAADDGARAADDGARAADNGARAADNGARAADNGARAADDGARAAVDGAEVAVDGGLRGTSASPLLGRRESRNLAVISESFMKWRVFSLIHLKGRSEPRELGLPTKPSCRVANVRHGLKGGIAVTGKEDFLLDRMTLVRAGELLGVHFLTSLHAHCVAGYAFEQIGGLELDEEVKGV